MILSRSKPAIATNKTDSAGGSGGGVTSSGGGKSKKVPALEDFLERRDYTGAMALLEFNRQSGKGGEEGDLWLGYCAFHLGDYKRAMLEFEALTHAKTPPKTVWINLACCYFYLGMYSDSEKMVEKGRKELNSVELSKFFIYKK
jgi:intraflagellar transport protein 56